MTGEETEAGESTSSVPRGAGLPFAGVYAFIGSGCMLVLELVAGRILAPALGVSLYTWTSVIGVVLAGVSLGNYLGGRLADRRPSRGMLSTLYLLSGISAALVLALGRDLSVVDAPTSLPALLQVVWLTALMFLLPSTLLAMPTPMLVKLSLASLGSTGRVVGRIQAAAALGSIVGTFLTGFFLISWFGTRAVVAGVAGMLVLLGASSGSRRSLRHSGDVVAALILVVTLAALGGHHCLRQSNYYCINVVAGSQAKVRLLLLDHLVHGYVDLSNPTHLLYPYEKLYEELLNALPAGSINSMFAIGGGTYTFPRYANAHFGAHVVVAEIDPAVTAVARSHLRLSDTPGIDIVHDDARRVLLRMDLARRFDVAIGDAFNDAAVPFHLTTRQFNELIAAHLSERGVYLVNVVDAIQHDFLRATIATLRRTFSYVAVMSANSWPPQGGRDTFVVVSSNHQVPTTASMVSPLELDRFEDEREPVVLTDDHVPVDQLLIPVFRQRLEQ
jgi:spermidine synthase